MTGRLEGQRAVITGATSGIGLGIARRFAAEGAELLVAGVNADDVTRTVNGLGKEFAGLVVGHVGDLSDSAGGDALRDSAMAALGGIEILVNNAGGGVIRETAQHTEQTLHETLDKNLWTCIRCTLSILPVLTTAGYGRIVNVGAESVRNGLDGHAVYNAAKGGVHAFAVGLAREHARSGVTINVVAPSYTLTPELQRAVEEGSLAPGMLDVLARAQELIPMGRPARVEEVAAAVLFLASPEASFVHGQVLSVNGGSSMG